MAANVNTMPHSIDAESALLGCLMIDNELQTEIIESLTEDDFYLEAHKYIVKAMRSVFLDKKPVDLVTLSDALEKSGELERAGGIAYITEIAQSTPSTANYRYYYDIVKRDSTNRKLIRAARKIVDNSMQGGEAKEAIQFAEKQIYDLSKQEENSSLKAMNEGDIVNEVIHKFEEIQKDSSILRGVETGFRQLDRITNGLQKSDLIILAARPGMGKTSFAMNIVEHAAMQRGKICAVFSLEMPRIQIVQRLLCSYAEVSMEKALSGKLEQHEWKKLFMAGDRLEKSKIYIDDSSRIMPAEILSKCRRLSAQAGGLDLVMIDYIQLMGSISAGSGNTESNRQQEIASISRDLKLMAKELNVPVIALSQLRRIQTKEPQLSDLRESGAIEQDADIVLFINRPEATATAEELASGKIVKGAAELVIAKHRNGSQGRVQLKFIGECTKFKDEDAQNRNDEPPMPVKKQPVYDDEPPEIEEQTPPNDDVPPPEPPPERTSDVVKAGEDDLPF
jgi:replicative DNA helicase